MCGAVLLRGKLIAILYYIVLAKLYAVRVWGGRGSLYSIGYSAVGYTRQGFGATTPRMDSRAEWAGLLYICNYAHDFLLFQN